MPRYFEFKDDKSSKFWEIDLHGNSYTVRFGKIGTQGQTQVKEFADEAAAQKEYSKLVDEKVKKGYVESGAITGGAAAGGVVASNVVAFPGKSVADNKPAVKSAQRSAKDFAEDEDEDEDDEDDDDEPRARKAGSGTTGKPKSGARRFEFEDDKSSKFWEISLEGSSFTVCYGRIGTDGQSQTKDFASEAQAQKEYEKLVNEKLKKGYEEVGSSGDDEEDEDFDDDDDADDDGSDENQGGDRGDDEVTLAGLRIEEWDQESGIEEPRRCAYKVGLTYEEDDEEGLKWADKFSSFLDDPKAAKVKALVVGSWGGQSMCEGEGSEEIIEALVSARDQLPNLKALFIADVDSETCEISWIQQTDMSPLFDAYPDLTHFRVRGGMELQLGTLKHKSLKSLVLESGGLSSQIVRSVANANLPELTHLQLWLGSSGYGADFTLDDLQPILSGKVFPKLRYLGLRNSEMADDLAKAVANAPIVSRISILDLSMGTMGDEGAAALLDSKAIANLDILNVGHHYMKDEMIERMRALKIVIGLEEREDEDKYGRYCEVSE